MILSFLKRKQLFDLAFFVLSLATLALVPLKALGAEEQQQPSSAPLPTAVASASLSTPSATPLSSLPDNPKKTSEKTSEQGESTSAPLAPAPSNGIRTYSSVPVEGSYIAMTFDDGPSATLTPRLLNILKERGIKATFFMIGENVAQHPDIVARLATEGHEIGNHTWSHPALTKLSEEAVREQITKTSDAIAQAMGKKPTLLRPPYGAINPRLTRLIEEQYGMKVIMWSVDPNDWKRPGASVVAQRILAGARPGAIILSHDIHPGTIEAMPTVLDTLKAKGYQFVTVSELIALESKQPPKPKETACSSSRKKKS